MIPESVHRNIIATINELIEANQGLPTFRLPFFVRIPGNGRWWPSNARLAQTKLLHADHCKRTPYNQTTTFALIAEARKEQAYKYSLWYNTSDPLPAAATDPHICVFVEPLSPTELMLS